MFRLCRLRMSLHVGAKQVVWKFGLTRLVKGLGHCFIIVHNLSRKLLNHNYWLHTLKIGVQAIEDWKDEICFFEKFTAREGSCPGAMSGLTNRWHWNELNLKWCWLFKTGPAEGSEQILNLWNESDLRGFLDDSDLIQEMLVWVSEKDLVFPWWQCHQLIA
jgi:hypothetical protein